MGFKDHKEGFVYLIHCVGFPYYKIGLSQQSPKKRLDILQQGSPFRLKLVLSIEIHEIYLAESILHSKFDKSKVRREWFNFTDYILDEVKDEFKKLEKLFSE